MITRFAVAGASLLLLAGCATASMRQPADLADSAAIRIDDIGHGRTGHFAFIGAEGRFSGRFRRSADRLSLFDALKTHRGTTDFTLDGPSLSAELGALCDVDQRVIDIGPFTANAHPMAYRCAFTSDGRPIPARFEVQEAKVAPTLQRRRRGEIALDRVVLSIRSTHAMARTPLPSEQPIGYVFEQDGRVIGSVDVNGTPAMRLVPGLDPAQRRAVYLASLALALLWAPDID